LNFADLSHEGCPFQTRSLELSPTTGTVSFSNGIPTNYAFDVRDDYLVGTPVDFHCAQNGDDLVTYSPGGHPCGAAGLYQRLDGGGSGVGPNHQLVLS